MSLDQNLNKILIIDFGSQFTQLIARRIRELGVFSEIISHKKIKLKDIDQTVKGIILSGGPLNVYQINKYSFDKKIINLNIPILGIVENMAYFTPEELPENKYYIFGKEGARNLATELDTPFLGEIPIIQSIRESGDVGRPAIMQDGTIASEAFGEMAKNVVSELVKRNTDLPPTEVVRITTMAGCSPKKEQV